MSREQLAFDYAEQRLKESIENSKPGDKLLVTREDAVIILNYIGWLFQLNSDVEDEVKSLEDDLTELQKRMKE